MKDFVRQIVYDSEYQRIKEFRSSVRRYNTLEEVQSLFIKKILKSYWWKKRYSSIKEINLYSKKRNSKDASAGPNCDIYLPKFFRDELSILHELAHIICFSLYPSYLDVVPGHGAEFLRVYSEMIRHFLGKEIFLRFKEILLEKKILF
jgi:hypothetical protein